MAPTKIEGPLSIGMRIRGATFANNNSTQASLRQLKPWASPYHITARCINKEWFRLSIPTVWSVMEDYLYLVATAFEIKVRAFVLMSNHFHLIVLRRPSMTFKADRNSGHQSELEKKLL